MFHRRCTAIGQRHSGTRQDRGGAAAVEAAIVLPVFFLLILYFMQFAWYFMMMHTVQNAARFGARSWAVQGYTENESRQRASQFLTDNGFDSGDFQVNSNIQNNTLITVAVSIPATANQVALTGDPFGILSWSETLSGTMTMQLEGSF